MFYSLLPYVYCCIVLVFLGVRLSQMIKITYLLIMHNSVDTCESKS